MPKINAHGSYLVLDSGSPFRVDHGELDYETDTVIDDVTDSGSNFLAEGLACLKKLMGVNFTAPERSEFYLALIGLAEGAVVNFYIKRGDSGQWDYVQGTIVKNHRYSAPQEGRARRVSVSCEYGSLFRNVAGPFGFV